MAWPKTFTTAAYKPTMTLQDTMEYKKARAILSLNLIFTQLLEISVVFVTGLKMNYKYGMKIKWNLNIQLHGKKDTRQF